MIELPTTTRGAWISRHALVFLVSWLILLGVGRTRMLRDPGTFWHTAAGERMLQTGRLIETDSFSFTQYGQPWIPQQWLAELAMASIHRLCGMDGLLSAACLVLAGTFTFLVARLSRAALATPRFALLMAIIVGASSYHFLARPHLLTIALMAGLFALLCDVENGRVKPNRLLWTIPLFVIWANLHGGALGGLGTILIVAMGWLLLPARRPDRRPPHRLVALAVCLSWGALLINPWGASLPAQWFGLMRSTRLPELIVEHAPPRLLSFEGLMLLALASIYLVTLSRCIRTGLRVVWLLPLVWFILALTRIRHGPIFAVTAAVAIADMLQAGPREIAKVISPPRPFFARLVLPVAVILLSVAMQAAGLRVPIVGAGWARLDETYWPTHTIDALNREIEKHPSACRVFNDMLFGGRLIHDAPRAKVYIDDRCELYGDQGLLRYTDICRNPELLEGLAQFEGVDWALVARHSRIDRYLATHPGWQNRAEDAVATLYRRVEGDRGGSLNRKGPRGQGFK